MNLAVNPSPEPISPTWQLLSLFHTSTTDLCCSASTLPWRPSRSISTSACSVLMLPSTTRSECWTVSHKRLASAGWSWSNLPPSCTIIQPTNTAMTSAANRHRSSPFQDLFWATRFLSATRFLILFFPYFSFLGRALDYAGHLISFWAHIKLPYRIISYSIVSRRPHNHSLISEFNWSATDYITKATISAIQNSN